MLVFLLIGVNFNKFVVNNNKLIKIGCLEEVNGAIRLTKHGAYFVEDVCDSIIDAALKEESEFLARTPHSEGMTSSRLN